MQPSPNFKMLHRTPITTLIQRLGFRLRYVVERDGKVIEQQLISTTEHEHELMFINLDDALQEAYRVFTAAHLRRYLHNQALVENTSWLKKLKLQHWSGDVTAKQYSDFMQDVSNAKTLSEITYETFCGEHVELRKLPEDVLAPHTLQLGQPLFVLNADGFVGSRHARIRETQLSRVYLRKIKDDTHGEDVYSFAYGCENLGEFNPHLTSSTSQTEDGEIPYSAMNIRVFYTEQQAIDAFHRVLNSAQCHLIKRDGRCFSLPTPANEPSPSAETATVI